MGVGVGDPREGSPMQILLLSAALSERKFGHEASKNLTILSMNMLLY